MKTKPTQAERIIRLLERGQSITPIQALERHGCFRLGARIHDLKKRGYDIQATSHKTKSGKTVAKYSLA